MNHEILDIIPVLRGDDLIGRLGFMLQITEPETGRVNSGVGALDFPDGIDAPYTDWAALIQASREYQILAAQVSSPLLEALTLHRRAAFAPAPVIPPTEAEWRARWVQQIDLNIANIITKRTQFQMGYEKREAAALAFKDRGYEGDPTVWVTAFADEAGFTPAQAADIILEQASDLRAALENLEALRMRKYRVMRAPLLAEAEAAFAEILNEAFAIEKALP